MAISLSYNGPFLSDGQVVGCVAYLVSPAHDLAGANIGHAGGQLTPLQHDVLRDLKHT